jgi:hypothetical protein
MKSLTEQSGPWIGQSVQGGIRIHETVSLRFSGNLFTGEGTDSDGHFHLDGEVDPSDDAVQITRRYVVAPKNPGQVGYPFIYLGRWDGYVISGRWMMSSHPGEGGTFEMWPEDERSLSLEQTAELVSGLR